MGFILSNATGAGREASGKAGTRRIIRFRLSEAFGSYPPPYPKGNKRTSHSKSSSLKTSLLCLFSLPSFQYWQELLFSTSFFLAPIWQVLLRSRKISPFIAFRDFPSTELCKARYMVQWQCTGDSFLSSAVGVRLGGWGVGDGGTGNLL